jgi:hypothetical protein
MKQGDWNYVYNKSFYFRELKQFEDEGTLRGDKLSAAEQANLITGTSSLQQCVQNCVYVQVFFFI